MDKVKINVSLRMDFQNLISCIECHAEEKNLEVIKESLKTIVNICAEEKAGKDVFREVGGLDFLLDFLLNTDEVEILEYCLNVLAFVIDGNIPNQMLLTNEKIFRILQAIFEKETYPLKVLKNAVVLFSTILFQNRVAQDLTFQNGSLLSLISLYKSFFPPRNSYIDSDDSGRLKIWLNINRSLCFAVNNPLNEKNQKLCSVLFPMTLKLIEMSVNSEIIEASSLFLSLTISNNVYNQNIFAEHDGFLILKRSLNKTFEQIQTYINECNNMISKETLLCINSLLSIISDSVLDHEKNATLCGKLGIVSLLVKILSIEALNISVVKKILLALGYCIDACKENRYIILDVSHFDLLLKENLESNDPELHSAARYLLQVCLDEPVTNQEESDFLDTETPRNDLELSFTLGKNSSLFKILEENIPSSCNKKENNATHKSRSDSLTFLNIPKFLTTFQDRTNPEDCINFSLEHNECNGKKQEHYRNMFHLKGENSKSDSESDISLQSAGHFNQMQKVKRRSHQNECKSYLKEFQSSDKTKSSSLSDKNCSRPALKRYNFNIINTNKASKTNRRLNNHNCKISTFGNAGKQKEHFIRLNNTATNNSKRSKSGKSDSSKFSLNINNATGNNSKHARSKKKADCAKVDVAENINLKNVVSNSGEAKIIENTEPNKCVQGKTFDSLESNRNGPSETILKVSPSCVSNGPFLVTKERSDLNSGILFEKDVPNSDNHPQASKSDEYHTFKRTNIKSGFQKPKAYNQHPPSCLEVIVLPGTVCSEHKLASMIELLKVCPINNAQDLS